MNNANRIEIWATDSRKSTMQSAALRGQITDLGLATGDSQMGKLMVANRGEGKEQAKKVERSSHKLCVCEGGASGGEVCVGIGQARRMTSIFAGLATSEDGAAGNRSGTIGQRRYWGCLGRLWQQKSCVSAPG